MAWTREGSKKAGRKAVITGQLQSITSLGGIATSKLRKGIHAQPGLGDHVRWHVMLGKIPNKKRPCRFCKELEDLKRESAEV
jgi:hypothetical protein